ncbi:MAG: VWA domain-containing protein [Elusimicrobiaceae bacterium]|nr:VWA domain-containing protein [Elusimicrobiaceae bacterium]
MNAWVHSILGDGLAFKHPWALGLLLLPLGILLVKLLRQGSSERRIFYPLVHIKLEQTSLRILLTRWLPTLLYTLTMALLIIALARPVHLDRTQLPPTEGLDIILLMDASASMQQKDFEPNRFVASQLTAKRFVEKRPSDRIGLVVFAKQAMLQAPLTLDHESLLAYISSMYLGMIEANYTAIGDALGVAANHLKDSKAKSKIIILLTDGDSNYGTIEPVLAAKAAAAYGIRVYTIGAASAPGQTAYSNQQDEINEGLLLQIAQTTGGQFYRAQNAHQLAQIYDTINELEKTTFTPPSVIYAQDRFAPWIWAALAAVLLAIVLEKLILIRIP